jgi:hypothetical protein
VVWVARGDQDRARFGINEKGLHITLELKNGQKASIEFGSEAPSNNAYASVILEGEVWILEFPWIVFRDVLSYLSVLPGQ